MHNEFHIDQETLDLIGQFSNTTSLQRNTLSKRGEMQSCGLLSIFVAPCLDRMVGKEIMHQSNQPADTRALKVVVLGSYSDLNFIDTECDSLYQKVPKS